MNSYKSRWCMYPISEFAFIQTGVHVSISTLGVVPNAVFLESQTLCTRLRIEEAPRVADTVYRQFASSWSERETGTQTEFSKHCLCQLGCSPTVRQRGSLKGPVTSSTKNQYTYTFQPLFHCKRRGICSLFARTFFTDSPASHSWRSYRPYGSPSETLGNNR